VVFLVVHPKPPPGGALRDKEPPLSIRPSGETHHSTTETLPLKLGPTDIGSDPSQRSDPLCVSNLAPDKNPMTVTYTKPSPCEECREAALRISGLNQQLLAAQGLSDDIGAANKDLGGQAEALKGENFLLSKQLEEVSTEAERLQVWRRVERGGGGYCGLKSYGVVGCMGGCMHEETRRQAFKVFEDFLI